MSNEARKPHSGKFSNYKRKVAFILYRKFKWDLTDAKSWCLYKQSVVRHNFENEVSTINTAHELNSLKG